ncbi:MAG TPA: dTMP kinase [Blastocatellia bacterium]
MTSGWFITFEGIDGSGKSSHLKRAAAALTGLGHEPVVTREPGGTPIGEQIRALLLSRDSREISPESETILYASDRAEHVRKVVLPALAAGRFVLCDRYVDSTVAFQGYGRGIDFTLICDLNRIATGGLVPDLTILLDVDPAVARQRLEARAAPGSAKKPADRFDDEDHDFHSRVRAGYFKLAESTPDRIRVVNTSVGVDEAHDRVMQIIFEKTGLDSGVDLKMAP